MRWYCILIVILIVQQNDVLGNPKGRSASAWSDICQRFPHLSGCTRQNDLPESVQPRKLLTPVDNQNNVPYCAKYKNHYDFYCNGTIDDNVIQFFCEAYRGKCPGTHGSVPTSTSGNSNVDAAAPPTWGELVDYCRKNKLPYSKLCVVNPGRPDAVTFCTGYARICPGTPNNNPERDDAETMNSNTPMQTNGDGQLVTWIQISSYCDRYKGSYWKLCMTQATRPEAIEFCRTYGEICPGAPDPRFSYTHSEAQVAPQHKVTGHQPNFPLPPMPDIEQSGPEPLRPQATPVQGQKSSAGSSDLSKKFPWEDGNLADLLGGPGPLNGLGDMNSMQLPFFGGHQDGGIGIGDGFMAPFFGMNKGTNVIPTKSVTTGEGYNVAGMKIGRYSNVDWSGTPGLGALNGDKPGNGLIPGFGRKKRK